MGTSLVHAMSATKNARLRVDHNSTKKGVLIGFLSGMAAISCCVSPVVLVLLGVASAAEAVSLGNTLYYAYGWAFRGAGVLVAAVAVFFYLRKRGSCSLSGARKYRNTLVTLVVTGGSTYLALFWLIRYLAIRFG